MELRYRPGTLPVAVGNAMVLALEEDSDLGVCAPVLAQVTDGAEVDDVVEALAALGRRHVPSFALVSWVADTVRVLVRGQREVRVESATGSEAVTGGGFWTERTISGGTGFSITGPGVEPDAAPGLPVRGGVVFVEVLTADCRVSRESEGSSRQVSHPAPAVQAHEATSGPPSAIPVPPIPEAPPAAPADGPPSSVEETSPEARSSATVEASGEPTDAPPAQGRFKHLFGATSMIHREPAEADEPEDPAVESGTSSASSEDAEPVVEAAPNDVPSAPPVGSTLPPPITSAVPASPKAAGPAGFIDEVPWAVTLPAVSERSDMPVVPSPAVEMSRLPHSAPAVPPGSPPGVSATARTDMTVNRAQLIAQRGTVQAPVVVAAHCPQGHLSPAFADKCRVCKQPLPPQQSFETPRPVLGRLVLSNGDCVTLDRGVIMGRNPRLPVGYRGEQPHVVKLSDPGRDVSGQHLEIRLDLWDVLVVDLGSTNGTQIQLPGGEPQRLRANDPALIEPGTVVTLADVLSFRFEALP